MYKIFICATILLTINTNTRAQDRINPARLAQLISAAEASHSEGLIIYHNNKLITEKYFGIGKPETKIEAMSATKSIVGLAVACLISDGVFQSLDQPVHRYFPEWKQGQKQEITIKHLVHMTSGIQNVPNAGLEIYPSDDFVQLALTAELTTRPGEVFSYNNKSLNLMAGLIQKATGKRMDEYIGERLLKPLGITDYTWTLDNAGNPHVMSGCQIKPMDLAKIGLLLLNKGKYQGEQIISGNAMDMVTAACEKFKAYGMLWWLDYEHTISVVDDEIIEKMKQAEIDTAFIGKVIALKGRYASSSEFRQKLMEVFGPQGFREVNRAIGSKPIDLRKREYSGRVTYRADGYLGNYIIVDPETNIVAIRMISHESHNSQADNFGDFRNRVLALTQ